MGGKVQVKSLMDAIRYFGRMKDIDETRIGLFGHSYGGFLTLRALSMDEVFEMKLEGLKKYLFSRVNCGMKTFGSS